jgi:hypothetical protein
MIRSKPRHDIRRVHPHIASGRAFGGPAGSCGLHCWVAAEDGCPAGRMAAFARVNEGEGGAEPGCARCRGLKRQAFKC